MWLKYSLHHYVQEKQDMMEMDSDSPDPFGDFCEAVNSFPLLTIMELLERPCVMFDQHIYRSVTYSCSFILLINE